MASCTGAPHGEQATIGLPTAVVRRSQISLSKVFWESEQGSKEMGFLEVGGGEPQAGTGHSRDRKWDLRSTLGSLFHSLCS